MATYLYRCPERHESTASASVGAAPERVACECGRQASRVFTPPMLSTGSPGRRAMESAEASADRPTVVDRVPPARRAAAPHPGPRHARLPRP